MKALVYHGPGQRTWKSVPDRTIVESTDAIVRIGAAVTTVKVGDRVLVSSGSPRS